MNKYVPGILLALSFVGCSSIWRMQSLESREESEWLHCDGLMGNWIANFYQTGFQFDKEGVSIRVCPSLLPERLIMIGPLLPIFPNPKLLSHASDSLRFSLTFIINSKGRRLLIKPNWARFSTVRDRFIQPTSIAIGTKGTQSLPLLFTGPRAMLEQNQDSVILLNERVGVSFDFCVLESDFATFNIEEFGIYDTSQLLPFPPLQLTREGKTIVSWLKMGG